MTGDSTDLHLDVTLPQVCNVTMLACQAALDSACHSFRRSPWDVMGPLLGLRVKSTSSSA